MTISKAYEQRRLRDTMSSLYAATTELSLAYDYVSDGDLAKELRETAEHIAQCRERIRQYAIAQGLAGETIED